MSTSPVRVPRLSRCRRLGRHRLLGALVVAGGVLVLPATAGAADPFYQRLWVEGQAASDGGNFPKAARLLRLACFGFLEEPPELASCLVQLALAQAENDDREAFAATFGRLLEAEERLSAYRAANLPSATRRAFEGHLERWITPEVLAATPAFAAVAERQHATRIAQMPAAERQKEVARRLAAEPGNLTWQVLAAELELDAGRPQEALAALAEILRQAPDNPAALCLRGRAQAALGQCTAALADFAVAVCRDRPGATVVAAARLGCHVALGDWQAAEALLATLPPASLESQPLRGLARDIEKRKPPAAPPEAAPEPEAAPATPLPAVPGAANPLTEDARSQLKEARRLLGERSREDLARAFLLAREVADAHPEHLEAQHLVAEIAYFLRRWPEAVTYFERGGEPSPQQPLLFFYKAVALYETDQHAAAVTALEKALPSLQRTEFVQAYVDKILGSGR